MITDYPKVSVVTITYGHEKYITETLDGVLMQDYPGEIEFIIANDNSPDRTDEVIQDYFAGTPIPDNCKISYTKHQVNKGVMPNFVWALEQATGEYIALCEGDDYWTDPLKLQKQVDFLETDQDYILSFTNIQILNDGVLKSREPVARKPIFFKEEIPHLYVPTLTVVFRNVVSKIPEQMYQTLMDATLFLYLSQYGKFNYLNATTGVYRMHSQGLYSGGSNLYKAKTSAFARIVAWRYLRNIDKVELAHKIIYLLEIQKKAEFESRRHCCIFKTKFQIVFFKTYVYLKFALRKINNLVSKNYGHNTEA